MPPVGFEPTISAGKRPQTYVLDCAATATGLILYLKYQNEYIWQTLYARHIITPLTLSTDPYN